MLRLHSPFLLNFPVSQQIQVFRYPAPCHQVSHRVAPQGLLRQQNSLSCTKDTGCAALDFFLPFIFIYLFIFISLFVPLPSPPLALLNDSPVENQLRGWMLHRHLLVTP